MWQQAGSTFLEYMYNINIDMYITKLNQSEFATYKDWRLPTVEEAMSIMESEKNENNLHINSIFDSFPNIIWTSDISHSSINWVVKFNDGFCDYYSFYDASIKAVRNEIKGYRHKAGHPVK